MLGPRSRSEIDFLDKNLEKSSKYNKIPPLVSYLRDILVDMMAIRSVLET